MLEAIAVISEIPLGELHIEIPGTEKRDQINNTSLVMLCSK